MHVLATCFRCAPIVLNANTLRVTFHLFYRTIYASIPVRNSNARLDDVLPLRSDCAQRKHTSCNVSFILPHDLCKHTRAK